MSLKRERHNIESLAEKANCKGEELFSKGDINGALDAFAKALEIDSGFALAHNNLGMLSIETGDMAKALEHLAKAFEIDPDDRDTVINCAEVFTCLKRYEEAGRIYLSYLENHPDDTEISCALAENNHKGSDRTVIAGKTTSADPADTGELEVLSFLSESGLISPFGVLMDIGANVGKWANQSVSLLPIMEIHLFEPVTKIFHELMKNMSGLIKNGNIYLNNMAVGDEEKLKKFYYYEDCSTWSTFYRRPVVEKEHNLAPPIIFPVPVNTLDRYCNHMNISRISFMKIDVEGAELEVLNGANKLFCEDRIDFIQFEYGGTFRDAGITLERVFQILSPHQFLMFKISPKGLVYISHFSPDMEHYRYTNFLAVNRRFETIFLKKQPCMLDLEKLLVNHDIHPRGVIHVGAHEGKEYEKYRKLGVKRVLFIEANPIVYQRLEEKFAEIEGVKTVNCAISNRKGTAKLHITSMDQSSSLLPLKLHRAVYPNIEETCQVTVKSTTLDSLVADIGLCSEDFNILNLDIQGAELMALQGAVKTLKHIDAVNTEVNFDELYEGCAHIDQIDAFMLDRGFVRRATTTPYHATWGDALYVKKTGGCHVEPR